MKHRSGFCNARCDECVKREATTCERFFLSGRCTSQDCRSNREGGSFSSDYCLNKQLRNTFFCAPDPSEQQIPRRIMAHAKITGEDCY